MSSPRANSPGNIQVLLSLDQQLLTGYLDELVPDDFRVHFDLGDTPSWSDKTCGVYRWTEGPRHGSLRVEVWPDPSGPDPGMALELADTHLAGVEAAWITLNDVRAERYDVDRDEQGNHLPLGSNLRNLAEENRALAAGLAPYQVRPGLHMFHSLIRALERFALSLDIGTLYVSPLGYHNAIQYEQHGFTYASEDEEMHWIDQEFRPGGALYRRMDGSTPFRRRSMAASVRGRSWAIHDGILGHRWVAPQMYKFADRDFHTCTFPHALW